MSDVLPQLWAEAASFYAASLAKSTQVQYHAHVRSFAYFCVATDMNFHNPDEAAVVLYATLLARTVAATTVQQYLKGLKDYYRKRGFSDFADPVAWPKLYAVLKGIARVKKQGVLKKRAITPAMLLAYGESLRRDSFGCAAWACVLVTFFGYFRKSNTTCDGASPYGLGKCLRVCDIEFVPAKYALDYAARI